SSILAPYVPTGPDYAVEARIQVIRVHSAGCSNFGILVRMTSDSQGGYKAEANCLSTDAPYSGSAEIDTDQTLIKADYAPGSDTHTYRVEVQGNQVRFLIDGSVIAETISNRFLSAGRISLIDDSVEVAVSSFTVLTIPVDASAVTPTPTSAPPTGNVLY